MKRGQFLNTEKKFYSLIDKSRDCWMWTGDLFLTTGYGRYWFRNKTWEAHRLMWTLKHKDKLGRWDYICHKCDIRACVNPAHLFKGTQKDNVHDMYSKGRSGPQRDPKWQKGDRNTSKKLTNEQIFEIRSSYRSTGSRSSNKFAIAKKFGIHPNYVNTLVRGKRRMDAGGKIVNKNLWEWRASKFVP